MIIVIDTPQRKEREVKHMTDMEFITLYEKADEETREVIEKILNEPNKYFGEHGLLSGKKYSAEEIKRIVLTAS